MHKAFEPNENLMNQPVKLIILTIENLKNINNGCYCASETIQNRTQTMSNTAEALKLKSKWELGCWKLEPGS